MCNPSWFYHGPISRQNRVLWSPFHSNISGKTHSKTDSKQVTRVLLEACGHGDYFVFILRITSSTFTHRWSCWTLSLHPNCWCFSPFRLFLISLLHPFSAWLLQPDDNKDRSFLKLLKEMGRENPAKLGVAQQFAEDLKQTCALFTELKERLDTEVTCFRIFLLERTNDPGADWGVHNY